MTDTCQVHNKVQVSGCCGAPIMDDSDICCKCRDHADAICLSCENNKYVGGE